MRRRHGADASAERLPRAREALADLQPEMDPKNRAIAFDIHRLKDSHRMHLLAMWMIFVWSGLFSILYRRELDLAGTLWPSVFKLKLTAYLSIALMHFVMWKSFSEEKAKYVFGYLGELKPDTALILLSGYTTVVLSFDDHRFVALLDSNESYASQITKSFELNPERPVPTCGGYAPGGKCYFNNIEASNLVPVGAAPGAFIALDLMFPEMDHTEVPVVGKRAFDDKQACLGRHQQPHFLSCLVAFHEGDWKVLEEG